MEVHRRARTLPGDRVQEPYALPAQQDMLDGMQAALQSSMRGYVLRERPDERDCARASVTKMRRRSDTVARCADYGCGRA